MRPLDQRFESLTTLDAFCKQQRNNSRGASVRWDDVRVEAMNDQLQLVGKQDVPAKLTNWSFSQLCQRTAAPSGFLSQLPTTLAAQVLNNRLANKAIEAPGNAQLLLGCLAANRYELRAATSETYTRVWNSDLTARLLRMPDNGWRVPPARPSDASDPRARRATAEDVLQHGQFGLSVREGDMIAPAGLYASDRDMFTFLVNERALIDDGSGNACARGFFLWNSEVGDKSLGIQMFLYQHVCGNHIVWDARNVQTVRMRHVGSINERGWWRIVTELNRAAQQSPAELEQGIKVARGKLIASTKEELLDTLFGMKSLSLSKRVLTDAYEQAEATVDEHRADPRSFWGMVEGITRTSQKAGYADERTVLDRAAGKLMEMAF